MLWDFFCSMKYLTFFFSLILVFGCSQSNDSQNREADQAEPVNWLTYRGQADGPRVVLVSGDEEYRSEEALPMMARILSEKHGFNCTVLFAQDPARPGVVDPNYVKNIPGLVHLEDADLMIIFTRFRALPDDQMAYIQNYLMKGKPVLGIRTATHAFMFQDTTIISGFRHYGCFNGQEGDWRGGFGRLVLGEKWINHHGKHKHQSTKGLIAPQAMDHPITQGLSTGDVWGSTDVYGVRLPLPGDSEPIILGQVTNRSGSYDEEDLFYGMRPTDQELPKMEVRENGDVEYEFNANDPMMPIAWTKSYQLPDGIQGRSFTSTIGSSTDLLQEGTRRLLVNASFWLLDKNVPAKADVEIVGEYEPTKYEFHTDKYWDQRNIIIKDLK